MVHLRAVCSSVAQCSRNIRATAGLRKISECLKPEEGKKAHWIGLRVWKVNNSLIANILKANVYLTMFKRMFSIKHNVFFQRGEGAL